MLLNHKFCDLIDTIHFRSTLPDLTAKVNSFDDLNKHTYSVIKPYVIKPYVIKPYVIKPYVDQRNHLNY